MKANKVFIQLLFVFCLAVSYKAQNKNHRDYNGLAIHVGTGLTDGGVGLVFEDQLNKNEKRHVAPYLGIGISNGGDNKTNTNYYWLGTTLGINFEFGKAHRLVFGPQFISNTLVKTTPIVEKTPYAFVPGGSFIIGYKGIAKFGLLLQAYIGIAAIQDPYVENITITSEPHAGIGIGYKF